MKHSELIALAEHFLRRSKKYPIILTDVRTNIVREQPDVIAWKNYGHSLLIECKATRADFKRDATKSFRRYPKEGMGFERYYLAPSKVIPLDALPEPWGLMEVVGSKIVVVKKSSRFIARNHRDETTLLVNALRRATEGWGRRMFGTIAPHAVDGDPHPTASKIIRELREEVLKLRRENRLLPRVKST